MLEHFARKAVPGGVPARGGVVSVWTGVGLDGVDDAVGEVDGPGGLAALIGDDVEVSRSPACRRIVAMKLAPCQP